MALICSRCWHGCEMLRCGLENLYIVSGVSIFFCDGQYKSSTRLWRIPESRHQYCQQIPWQRAAYTTEYSVLLCQQCKPAISSHSLQTSKACSEKHISRTMAPKKTRWQRRRHILCTSACRCIGASAWKKNHQMLHSLAIFAKTN